MIINSVRWRA